MTRRSTLIELTYMQGVGLRELADCVLECKCDEGCYGSVFFGRTHVGLICVLDRTILVLLFGRNHVDIVIGWQFGN